MKVFGANYRLVVKPSPIHGDGVFAAEDIPWGRKDPRISWCHHY
jgi:hypothetical protein